MTNKNYAKESLLLELDRFTDRGIRRFTEKCIEDFPEYFWTAPASGTGLWHDEEENLEGGLVVHVRRLMILIEELSHFYALSFWEKDVLLSAAILHDSWCKGMKDDKSRHSTDVFHPLYVSFQFPYMAYGMGEVDEKTYQEIMLCVVGHSGRWSVSPALNIDKKLPRLFALADYIASRKSIKIKDTK